MKNTTMKKTARSPRRAIALALALALSAAACGSDSAEDEASSAAETAAEVSEASDVAEASEEEAAMEEDAGEWPRTIVHDAGETVIESKPERIGSTSLTLTASLLAIGAPITHSAATSPGPITDDLGFFAQWSDAAAAAGVEVLYPNLEIDLEAIIVAEPDLIIVSTKGGDAAVEHYDALSEIAPTIAYDFSSRSWQEMAAEIAIATGNEAEAEAIVAQFDAFITESAAKLTLPEDKTLNVLSFNALEYDTGIAQVGSAHALIFEALGFEVLGAPAELDTSETPRADFAFVTPENLSQAILGATVVMIAAEEDKVEEYYSFELLTNVPSVDNKQAYALGQDSFRLDYYSATKIVNTMIGFFG